MFNNCIKIIDSYQDLRSERENKSRMFLDGTRPYMIFQTPAGVGCGNVQTPQESF